jgi:hypothetical protein
MFEELPPQEVRGIDGLVMIFAVQLAAAANPKKS